MAYNSKPVFTITAKPGYVLSDITMNTATIGTLPSGTFQNDNTTTYSYTSTALTGSTEIKAVFKAKEQVTVTISPEYATLDEIRLLLTRLLRGIKYNTGRMALLL